jgi:hypothetical protein
VRGILELQWVRVSKRPKGDVSIADNVLSHRFGVPRQRRGLANMVDSVIRAAAESGRNRCDLLRGG